ncbi:MAG: hypothetical protein RBJ76_19975 [Stenomitos frigidus ULC029]
MDKIRIVLIEDQDLTRVGLRLIFHAAYDRTQAAVRALRAGLVA